LPQIRQKAGAKEDEKCQQPQAQQSGKELAQVCTAGNEALVYIMWRKYSDQVQLVRMRIAGNGVPARYSASIEQVMEIVRQGNAKQVLNRETELESERIARAVRTAPGQGVQDGDIAAVHVEWEQVRSGTSLRMEYTTRLLLKDGTGYRGPEIPPDELNVKVSRQLEPGRWFQWRKPLFGKGYEMRGPDDKDWRPMPEQSWIAQPARSGERLNGAYTSSAGSGSWIVGTLRTTSSTWYFKNDGTFETSFFARTTTGFMEGINDHSVGTTTLANSKGSSTTVSVLENPLGKMTDTPLVAGGSTRRTGDGADRRGRYRFKGWVLEVERDDGSTGRYFVSFMDGKRDSINIGDSQFSIPTR